MAGRPTRKRRKRLFVEHRAKMSSVHESPSFFRRRSLYVIEILHEHNLVLRFVIQKFIGSGLRHQDSKATWANSAFFANGHMGCRIRFRLADRCMRESFE